jgi:thioredoxin-dependent peroxiredoxin
LPLSPGSPAPRFAATAHNGEKVSIEGLRGKVVVLYFYPKDGTPGCTTEAKEFRDQYASFQAKNAVVIGVSSDNNDSHEDFAQELGLPFLLLPDTQGAIRNAYGVGSFLGLSSRVTFIIDREGRIAEIYPKVDPKSHAGDVLRALDRL